MKIKNLFVSVACFLSSLCGANDFYIVDLSPSYDVGFFSVFTTVVGALDFYEQQKKAGLRVDFATRGAYFDSRYGNNWWQYYFEPIEIGSKKKAEICTFSDHRKAHFSNDTKYLMKRSRAHYLIKKYIHIKPHIRSKIRSFYNKNFKKRHIIGIHYRGTDKVLEASGVSYEQVLSVLNSVSKKYRKKSIQVFVATDEENFLHYLQEHCPYPVIFYDAIRSTNDKPVHLYQSENNYKKGEDALIDSLLLSKCDYLIKMASNLSDVSLLFNPHLKWTSLNTSYEQQRHYASNCSKS